MQGCVFLEQGNFSSVHSIISHVGLRRFFTFLGVTKTYSLLSSVEETMWICQPLDLLMGVNRNVKRSIRKFETMNRTVGLHDRFPFDE